METSPFVSICTPTFNRRPFLTFLATCIQNQTYPQDRMEWIIVDDGSDCVKDVIDVLIPQMQCTVKYFYCSAHKTLGDKRNWTHAQCSGDILVNMDDDDYYPPTRVEHAVSSLTAHPECLIAGSDIMYIYYFHLQHPMYKCGPHGTNRATAATFAFRKELLEQTSYPSDAVLTEEPGFLRNYTFPMVQLDPHQTILVFSHAHNSLDKNVLLEMKEEVHLQETDCSVTDIMPPSTPHFEALYSFYTDNLHTGVVYPAGDLAQKPWVAAVANSSIDRHRAKKIKAQADSILVLKDANNALHKQLSQKSILVQRLMDKIKNTIN